jgi:hypothetical protein
VFVNVGRKVAFGVGFVGVAVGSGPADVVVGPSGRSSTAATTASTPTATTAPEM